MKKKILLTMALSAVMVFSFSAIAMANDGVQTIDVQQDTVQFAPLEQLESETLINTAICLDPIMTRASQYNISSNVKRKNDLGQMNTFYADGWVDITYKDTGLDVKHYTTARLETGTGVTTTSGRQWGWGRVPATSPYGLWGDPYIYYGFNNN